MSKVVTGKVSKKCQMGYWAEKSKRQKERASEELEYMAMKGRKRFVFDGYSTRKGQWWSEKDLDRLSRILSHMVTIDWEHLMEAFPHRSKHSIVNAIQKYREKLSRTKRFWTWQEDKILYEMAEQGFPYKDIAKKLPRRTIYAIKARVARYYPEFLKKKKLFTQEEIEYLEMASKIKTVQELADSLKRDKNVVNNKLNALGIQALPRRTRQRSGYHGDVDKTAVSEMYKQGYSTRKIADTLGIGYQKAYDTLRTIKRRENVSKNKAKVR